MLFVFQQKESKMLNRTLLLSVIAVAVSAPLLFYASPSAVAVEKTFSFHIENAIILGQSASKSPTAWERLKQGFNKFLQDDTPAQKPDHRPALPIQPAVPTQPPKPPTTAEIQQSATVSSQGRRAATTSQPRQESGGAQASTTLRDSVDDGEDEIEVSVYARLQKYREPYFSDPALEKAARNSRERSSVPKTTLTPSAPPSFYDTGVSFNSVADDSGTLAELPAVPQIPAVAEVSPESTPETVVNRQPMPRNDQREPVVLNQPPVPVAPSQPPMKRLDALGAEQDERALEKQLVVSVSPRLEVEIEKPLVTVVGQEVTYRIRVSNTGNAPAEQVVVTAEIPSWINVRHADTNNGKAVVLPREDGSGMSDLRWRISRVDYGSTDLLILRIVPQQRRSIELLFSYDFYRPAIVAKVDVQEPKLEMELLGSDEVLWNDLVVYTLLVRNIGNGDAENLRLTLQQTNSEAAQCEFEEPLRPGEEQPIAISVQAGKEQEYIDIAVLAMGAHELKGEVKRRIRVLRPKLEMSVQTPALHFVDNPAEFTIRVRNVGSADADNIGVRAELPLGAQYAASSEGGIFATLQQQSIVEWRGRSIARGETQTFLLTCVPKREGDCRVSVEVCDPSGGVMVAGNGTFTAEAVTELDLVVLKPRGHVELGQEAEYTIQVTNIGTKAAENVEVSMAFGLKEGNESIAVLEPINVAGSEAFLHDGMVVFEKIPVILPKQSVELKVIAKAEQTGTVQVKTQVSGRDINGLGNELSTTVFSRRTRMATSSDSSSQNEIR